MYIGEEEETDSFLFGICGYRDNTPALSCSDEEREAEIEK